VTADSLLRLAGPLALGLLAAWAFDRMTARRGFDPPGFAEPWRRGLALLAVGGVLWAGVFLPLGEIGRPSHLDVAKLGFGRLFLLHELMIGAILVWFLAGFAGLPRRAPATLPAADDPAVPVPAQAAVPVPAPRPPLGRQLAVQLGLATPSPGREVGLGLLLGIAAWLAVIVSVAAVAFFIIYGLGAKGALPKQPPELIPWLAALPFALRLLLALSAGVVEEAFFRGLLQPRMGIVLSTGMFILAHTAYGQPFLLLGVGILSVIYAFLVRWRQNIWPAMAAHALFDGVQLLVIIPMALKLMGGHLPAAFLGPL
jgi:membrane protease YdiL (CAAX protease family)